MPLSKKRDRERKQKIRLELLIEKPRIQPKVPTEEDAFDLTLHNLTDSIQDHDADGYPVYEE